MTTPSRSDKMIINMMHQKKQKKKENISYSEDSEYKHLLWDFERGQLPKIKQSRFEELRRKYGNK